MTRRPRIVRAAAAVALLVPLALLVACSTASKGECDCVDPALRISVPSDVAGAVTEVRLGGPACTGVTATCAQQVPAGCADWRFAARAPGTCHVEVAFATGTTFAQDVTIQETTGCCAGLYATPASAADITVPGPSPDGGEPG